MPLNLNHLRIFREVLEQGSITGAASALRISQPAVSRQLAEFEAALGTRLVDRLPRGIRATAAGEMLGERARRIFAEERAAEQDLGELLGLHRGHLAVGASTTIGSYLVPQVFGDFAVRHRDIAIDLRIGNTRAIQNDVLEGELDVGLTEGFADAEPLESEVFLHDEMVLIAGPHASGRPLAGVTSIHAAELANVPFIVREAGSGTREVIEAALAGRGVDVRPHMVLGSTEAIKNAVVLGLGVAIVSRLTVTLECDIGRLREVALADLRIHRALHCVTLRGKRPSPAATEFLALLRERYGAAGESDGAATTPKSSGGSKRKHRKSPLRG
ncbi:MAG TPA: LysR family transcriptional regulator [Candidatus Limnocylindrales bacterium]|nr:LysR family transcriptional regulator [Candidatus Limnocylindrales bacterium]